MHRLIAISCALLMAFAGVTAAQDATDRQSWSTRSGYYRVSYKSRLEPLAINRMHDWVIHVEDAVGTPVNNATLSVTGGMPKHNHGLPTEPRMTKSLGNGDYLMEGMRFHMSGDWELTVTVDAAGRRDTAIISLTI